MTTIDNFVNSFIKMNNMSKAYFARLGEVTNIALRAGRALTQIYATKLALIMDALRALIAFNKKMQGIAVIRFGYAPPLYPLTFRRRREELYPSALEELNISFLLNVTFVEEEISKMIRGLEERVGELMFMPSEGAIRMAQRFTPLAVTRAIQPSLTMQRVSAQYILPAFFSHITAEAPEVSPPPIQEYVGLPQSAFRAMQRYVEEVPKMVETFKIVDQMKGALETTSRGYKIPLIPTISEVQQLPASMERKIALTGLTRLEPSLSGITTTDFWRLTFAGIPEIISTYNIISSTTAGLTYPPYGVPQALRPGYDTLMLFISLIREIFALVRHPSIGREIVKVYGMGDQLRGILEMASRSYLTVPMITMREAVTLPTFYAPISPEGRVPAVPELRPLMPGIGMPMIMLRTNGIISQMVTGARGVPQIYQALTLSLSSALSTGITTFRPEEPTWHISPLTMWISGVPGLTALRMPQMILEAASKAIPTSIFKEMAVAPTVQEARMISGKGMVEAFDLSKIYRIEETKIAPRPFVGLLTKLGKGRLDFGRLTFEDISKIPSSIQILSPPTMAPTYQPISISKALAPSRIAQIQPSILERSFMKEPIRTIQNTFNITVQAASLGDEKGLRELRRKIEQILAEEARRYFGSTLM